MKPEAGRVAMTACDRLVRNLNEAGVIDRLYAAYGVK